MRDVHNPFEIIDNRLSNIEKLVREIKNAPREDYSIKYYTKKEVAVLFRTTVQTISNYIKRGWLKAEQFGPRLNLIQHYQIFNEDQTLKNFKYKRKAK